MRRTAVLTVTIPVELRKRLAAFVERRRKKHPETSLSAVTTAAIRAALARWK